MEPLFFRENDKRGADAILFLHGGGVSGRMWEDPLLRLSDYHCLAPDLPGHGRSVHITPFTRDLAVERLADLVRGRVPTARVSVVAISVGVSIATGLIEQHPELVEKAFLSGPTPRFGRVATSLMNMMSRPLLALTSPEQRVQFAARSMGLSDSQIGVFRDDLHMITPDLVLQINDVVARQTDPGPKSPPTIVLVGEKEVAAVKKRARALVSVGGNTTGFVVCGLGHAWCLEDPALFEHSIRAWMSGAAMETGVSRSRFEAIRP